MRSGCGNPFRSSEFAACYLGYYLCNGAVVAQEFGDRRADEAARDVFKSSFPDREVIQLATDAVAAGGGTIHCVTQQEPASYKS